MKRLRSLLIVWLVSIFVISCLIFTTLISSNVKAQSANKPDWIGRWICNLDGRPAIIELTGNRDPNTCFITNGETICTLMGSTTNVAGKLSDNGGAWQTIYTRPFFPKQGEQPEYDHIIPLELNNQPWLLLRHTWDQRYMSGYTIWEGRAFGIQCHR